ncbi:MAG TPA: alpha/beta fold hydrolase, partial [Actinomycetes bacterium]|nr:alpha/beta fold hydrolase [Actinomycetes bacterium]
AGAGEARAEEPGAKAAGAGGEEAPGPSEPAAPPATVYGDGTPVVLLHAFPLDSRMWLPQVEALGGYQVIVPDLRGFGSAREQAAEVTPMDLLADDLAKLLDERELERAVLCGLSMGGYVALAFARRHPERLGGLALCNTRPGADSENAKATRLSMAERLLAEGVDFLPEAMVPRLLGETALKERPDLAGEVTATILDQDPRGIAAAQRGMAERSDSTGVLGGIGVPTLVVTGLEDRLISPDEGVRMAAEIRDARLIQVPDAGHLVNLERPDPVNEALLDFLAPLWI